MHYCLRLVFTELTELFNLRMMNLSILGIQKIAAEIKSFSADGCVSPKLFKRADKSVLYLLTAGKKALADAGITEQVTNVLDKTRCGLLLALHWEA